MAERNVSTPEFIVIVDYFRERIIRGEISVGDRLPTEEELCVRFAATRYMVREAFKRLQEKGLIERRQGFGSVVISRTEQKRFENSISNLEELLQYAKETNLIVLSTEKIILDAEIAQFFNVPPHSIWIRISALRCSAKDDMPFAYSEIFIPERFDSIVKDIGTIRAAVYSLIENEYNVVVTKVIQRLEARAANANIASRLSIPNNSPILVIIRHYMDSEGDILEFAINSHPADRYHYEIVLKRSDSA